MWGWRDGPGGWGWLWMALMIAFLWLPLLLALIWLLRQWAPAGEPLARPPTRPPEDAHPPEDEGIDAAEIARRAYPRGDLSRARFLEIVADLEESGGDA